MGFRSVRHFGKSAKPSKKQGGKNVAKTNKNKKFVPKDPNRPKLECANSYYLFVKDNYRKASGQTFKEKHQSLAKTWKTAVSDKTKAELKGKAKKNREINKTRMKSYDPKAWKVKLKANPMPPRSGYY